MNKDNNKSMGIAQTIFGSLSKSWADHRQSRTVKLRTYQWAVYSTLSHSSEVWTLTAVVMRIINGLNIRCLHLITDRTSGTRLQTVQCRRMTRCVQSANGNCGMSVISCAISFSPLRLSSLSCINEYPAFGSGVNVSE